MGQSVLRCTRESGPGRCKMGCAASRQVRVTVSAETGGGGDTVIVNLTSALASKREALQMLDAAAGSGRIQQAEMVWANDLRSTICDLEKVVAQRRAALEAGDAHSHRQACVFSHRLAETAAVDLQRWISDHKTPALAAPCSTPPSAVRRKEITVLTPPESSLQGLGFEGDARDDAVAELELRLAAARNDLQAHLAQAEARAAELRALKDRAVALRALGKKGVVA